ncbi:2Fe-2S iron-sulfur cluster binding domain-containing protein [Deferribacter autotrophicus]|uniref:2Fe-2S iron-sulfur cluster binding domain-containing protein n=1 Tax=Deferribacter autotrophicus TaxID=500465 RepID=A0A5A8F3U5_9BACT|nr:molybdopterin-dependent oxidoreductase [Deferribacter autotrophicus]KAA0257703.1 2Fe-2S iron-sulfur cluster binding domain-containing protein [Deferribacter autotrophicus]
MLTVKIDGIEVKVEPGTTILEAAEKAGVYIPIMCHHKNLNPFGACRVCLVEVKGSPKLMTACTTPVTDNMEVITNSEKLKRIRKTLIELLLINHPLDCPVCDKGGECLLQDLTYEFGITKVRFDEKPNNSPVDHTNPFIERDIDRCVLCGKCVRICDEIVNVEAISFINRGVETYIGTAFDQPWNCEYCGQCMSVCPVGSLNNRVYLFKNRPWHLEHTESICGYCSCGCTVIIDHENNEVYRIKEDVYKGVNKGLLCAKGRFGYELINSTQRPVTAKVKDGNEFKDVDFDGALNTIYEKLSAVISKYGNDSVAFVISPRLTNEEAFLAQKFAREVVKTNNIYSLETINALPDGTYNDVESSNALIVFNIDVTESNPVLGYSVRVAGRREESNLYVFYPNYTPLKRVATEFYVYKPSELYNEFELFLKALDGENNKYSEAADNFKNDDKPVFVFNPYNPKDVEIAKKVLDKVSNVKLVPAKAKNNSQGIVDMGCFNGMNPGLVETDKGVELREGIEADKIKALIVLGENLAVRSEYFDILNLLNDLELFVVTDPFFSETAELSNVYIPVATFAEKDGSFTNFEGRVQSLHKAVDKGVKTDKDVIVELAKKFGTTLPYETDKIREMIEVENPLYIGVDWNGGIVSYPYKVKIDGDVKFEIKGSGKYELYPAYLRLHSGSYTRRSYDLSKVYGEPIIEINPEDAKELNVKDNDYLTIKIGNDSYKYRVKVDKKILQGAISLPKDFKETAPLFYEGSYLKVDLIKHI